MRKSDSDIKNRLRILLSKALDIPIQRIVAGKTTDLIVKNSDNDANWYYFEIKFTDYDERKDKKKYFGAITLNQLIEAERYIGRYFFILVSIRSNIERYAIISPQNMISYLTGYYLHADFSIPESDLQKYCVDSDSFTKICVSLLHSEESNLFPRNKNDKTDKINRLKNIVKQQSNGTD